MQQDKCTRTVTSIKQYKTLNREEGILLTETEYQEIKLRMSQGLSLNKATITQARKVAFLRMRKQRGEYTRRAVIQEAQMAAHQEVPTFPNPPNSPTMPLQVYTADMINNESHELVDVRKMLEMAKRAIMRQLDSRPSVSWIKLALQICEKEIPEWNSKNTKSAKDEYQAIVKGLLDASAEFEVLGENNDAES